LRRIVFILFVHEQLAEPLAELFHAEIALDFATVTNRNLAGLLGDDEGDGIGFIAEPESGAVAQAEVAVEILALGEGKMQAAATMRSPLTIMPPSCSTVFG
jgi:hypothetical protein